MTYACETILVSILCVVSVHSRELSAKRHQQGVPFKTESAKPIVTPEFDPMSHKSYTYVPDSKHEVLISNMKLKTRSPRLTQRDLEMIEDPDTEYKREAERMIRHMVTNAKKMPANHLQLLLQKRTPEELHTAAGPTDVLYTVTHDDDVPPRSKAEGLTKYVASHPFIAGVFFATDFALVLAFIILVIFTCHRIRQKPTSSSYFSKRKAHSSVLPYSRLASDNASAQPADNTDSLTHLRVLTDQTEKVFENSTITDAQHLKSLTLLSMEGVESEPSMLTSNVLRLHDIIKENSLLSGNQQVEQEKLNDLKKRMILTGDSRIDSMLIGKRQNFTLSNKNFTKLTTSSLMHQCEGQATSGWRLSVHPGRKSPVKVPKEHSHSTGAL